MKLKKIFIAVILLISFSTYGQSDDIWKSAVEKWEASKSLKAGYCVKSIVAAGKGYSSDYNKEGAVFEGDVVYVEGGGFRVNTNRFVNKGEEYILDEPKLSKDTFPDLMQTKENLIFAKKNQEFLTIKKIEKESSSELYLYSIIAKIPNFPEFNATVSINTTTGFPVKVINDKYSSNDNASAESKITITYKEENGHLIVNERLEEAKVEFFGNASYITELYIFSKYK